MVGDLSCKLWMSVNVLRSDPDRAGRRIARSHLRSSGSREHHAIV
jgi:hypothetical protein